MKCRIVKLLTGNIYLDEEEMMKSEEERREA